MTLLISVLTLSCSKDASEKTKTISDENGNQTEVDISVNQRNVGDSANDLLSEQKFDTLSTEIFYVEGLEPTSATIEAFENFLSERLNKSGGIEITLKEIASPGKSVYSITDIRALEDDIRTAYNENGKVAVFGIFIDGEYSENTDEGSVLGVAYRNTSFVIFEETIRTFSSQPFAPNLNILESTVLHHEFGHLMGMVNVGTTMQTDHQDVEHGKHCTEENCLMFWTAETGEGILNMLGGGTIPKFDSFCIADLQANGGK